MPPKMGLAHGWDKPTLLKRVLRQAGAGLRHLAIGCRRHHQFGCQACGKAQPGASWMWCATGACMARVVKDGAVENIYRLHLMNATEEVAALQRHGAGADRAGAAQTVGTVTRPG
jgi:hypothetical protein